MIRMIKIKQPYEIAKIISERISTALSSSGAVDTAFVLLFILPQ